MKDVRILKISQNIFNNKLLKKETSSQSNKKYFTDEFVEELFKVFQKDDIESQEKFVQQGLDDYGHHDIVYQFLSLNTENLKYCIQAYTKDKEINGKDNALSSFISKKGHGKIRPILKKVHCSIEENFLNFLKNSGKKIPSWGIYAPLRHTDDVTRELVSEVYYGEMLHDRLFGTPPVKPFSSLTEEDKQSVLSYLTDEQLAALQNIVNKEKPIQEFMMYVPALDLERS